MKTFKDVLKTMPTCIFCLSRVRSRFAAPVFGVKKSKTCFFLCKTCKQHNPTMSELLSSHTEDQISDLLEKVDIGKVFKCITRVKKEKLKNMAQYKLLLRLLLKKDFTQTLIDNIYNGFLVSVLLSYPAQIQWRKMHDGYTVLEFFLLNVTDPGIIDMLREKIQNIPNKHNVLSLLPTEPPPYSSLNFQENVLPPAPREVGFSGKWVLLYNSN